MVGFTSLFCSNAAEVSTLVAGVLKTSEVYLLNTVPDEVSGRKASFVSPIPPQASSIAQTDNCVIETNITANKAFFNALNFKNIFP